MKNSRKVLHIITLSEWGGAQQVCYDLVTNLDKDKFSVEVACAPGGELVPRLNEQGVVVHTIDSLKRDISPFHDLKALYSLYRLIKKGQYDIVHCHSTKAGFLGRIAAWLTRVSQIYFTVHGWGFYNTEEYGYIHTLLAILEKIGAWTSDKLICVSANDKKQALKKKITSEDKLTIVHNGIRWQTSDPEGHLRTVIDGNDKDVLFGIVARLAPQKNPLLFLKAAEKVAKRHEESKFVVIGDGPLYEKCKNFIQKRKLQSQIFMLGFRGDARKLLLGLNGFVLSSRWEGLPLTIIEAMFAGLPIISTDVGGINELIQDGRNGFLTEPDDVNQLAEKMMYLIENPEKRNDMGKESSRIANERFTIDKMVEEYEKLYKS